MKYLAVFFVTVALGNVCIAQDPAPARRGPSIGISVQNYYEVRNNGVLHEGVRITGWNGRNSPYQWAQNTRKNFFTFRRGFDVILEVNGNPVSNANDVLRSTQRGRNTLKIYDMKTRRLDTYQIDL